MLTDGRRVPTVECASDVLAALGVRSANLRQRLPYPFQARRQHVHTKSVAELSRNQIRLIEPTRTPPARGQRHRDKHVDRQGPSLKSLCQNVAEQLSPWLVSSILQIVDQSSCDPVEAAGGPHTVQGQDPVAARLTDPPEPGWRGAERADLVAQPRDRRPARRTDARATPSTSRAANREEDTEQRVKQPRSRAPFVLESVHGGTQRPEVRSARHRRRRWRRERRW